MKFLLFATLMILNYKASAFQDIAINFDATTFNESESYMKGVCESQARITGPMDATSEIFNDDNNVFVVVESLLTEKTEDPNHMVVYVYLNYTKDRQTRIGPELQYNCFRCLNRSLEQIVLTKEADSVAVCSQENI
jgi:hypothetical protein